MMLLTDIVSYSPHPVAHSYDEMLNIAKDPL